MAEQNITIKQKNSSGSYDTLYPATTVNQLSGVLPESKGGTGVTSLSAMLTAAGGARIQIGSYVGTGTYGASNPCSLTFDFVPKCVIVANKSMPEFNLGTSFRVVIMIQGQTNSQVQSSALYVSWTGNTVRYYTTDNMSLSGGGINVRSETYLWVAIG